jgi:hypothetical protein
MGVACKAACTSAPRIAIASTASASSEAAAPGPGADEHPSAFKSGLPLRLMRTNKELKVNGRCLWDLAKTHEPRVDRGWLHQGLVLATNCPPVRTIGFMEAICLDLSVRERHHGVFHEDKRWLVGCVANPKRDSAE